ncbi:MAG TPA: arginine deiminase family protein [Vicinamibacterales bacterium]|nr:arginine deiminase family protein [Vicinamibacterales bacterium]
MQKIAITRAISSSLANCELTHLDRVPIDLARARAQHADYERALTDAGYRVERLTADEDMPDSVFVEDVAVVFDELAIITRPGAESRRREVPAVAAALRRYRPLQTIVAPGTVDGGDVMTVGTRVFVGLSSRTNGDGIAQMRAILAPHGYRVDAVTVSGCLHLKSAVTAVSDRALVINRAWIDAQLFDGFELIDVDPSEPTAANVVRLEDRLIVPSAFPRTAERLRARGFRVVAVDASEVAKAEGAVTCCSLLL